MGQWPKLLTPPLSLPIWAPSFAYIILFLKRKMNLGNLIWLAKTPPSLFGKASQIWLFPLEHCIFNTQYQILFNTSNNLPIWTVPQHIPDEPPAHSTYNQWQWIHSMGKVRKKKSLRGKVWKFILRFCLFPLCCRNTFWQKEVNGGILKSIPSIS